MSNRIILAPTTLPDTPPLAYIAAAVEAGYDALSLRLNASPGLLAALPPGLPLSVEFPHDLSVLLPEAGGRMMPPAAWAKLVLSRVRAFLTGGGPAAR